jgi:SAM-dependent methyltransferase
LGDRTICPEDSTDRSPTLNRFRQRLADQLVERYALRGKKVLEIGCGRGELLTLVCELGDNRGVGYVARCSTTSVVPRVKGRTAVRHELFNEATVTGPTDLVCCRMMLEHTPDPARLVGLLQRVVKARNQTRLFLQVPDVVRTLKQVAFWDIHYQHCSYFSAGTLHRLLCAQGFAVGDVWTEFEGKYLMADAQAAINSAGGAHDRAMVETIADLEDLVVQFTAEYRQKQAMWCQILREMASTGNRIAIWGAGPTAVSFLTTLAVGEEIAYVVDVNPARQGKYTPGTGHRIVTPEVAAASCPDVVIVTNSVYAFEIQEIFAQTGCAPTLLIA